MALFNFSTTLLFTLFVAIVSMSSCLPWKFRRRYLYSSITSKLGRASNDVLTFNPEFDRLFSLLNENYGESHSTPQRSVSFRVGNRLDGIRTAASTMFALALANGMVDALDLKSLYNQIHTFENELWVAEENQIAHTLQHVFKGLIGPLSVVYKRFIKTGENPIAALNLAMKHLRSKIESYEKDQIRNKPDHIKAIFEESASSSLESHVEQEKSVRSPLLTKSEMKNPSLGCQFDNDNYLYRGKKKWTRKPRPALRFPSYDEFQKFRFTVEEICASVMESTTYNDVDQLIRYVQSSFFDYLLLPTGDTSSLPSNSSFSSQTSGLENKIFRSNLLRQRRQS